MGDRSVATPVRWLLAASVALLLLAACAEEPDAAELAEPEAEAPQADEPADEEPDDDEEPAEPADVRLEVAEGELGTYLVDGDGMTLYLFTPDEAGESTCYDGCAEAWPPLLAGGGAEAGDDVDETLVGTTTRDDGATQVTYAGWPLYHFASDEAPGDVVGQGVEDVWFVLGPDGEMIEAAADDEGEGDDGAGAGGGGY